LTLDTTRPDPEVSDPVVDHLETQYLEDLIRLDLIEQQVRNADCDQINLSKITDPFKFCPLS